MKQTNRFQQQACPSEDFLFQGPMSSMAPYRLGGLVFHHTTATAWQMHRRFRRNLATASPVKVGSSLRSPLSDNCFKIFLWTLTPLKVNKNTLQKFRRGHKTSINIQKYQINIHQYQYPLKIRFPKPTTGLKFRGRTLWSPWWCHRRGLLWTNSTTCPACF